MQRIRRIHNTHYLYENDTSIVSFNPNTVSCEAMFQELYSVAIRARYDFGMPYFNREKKMVCTESNLAGL